jgi:hypothetical protein
MTGAVQPPLRREVVEARMENSCLVTRFYKHLGLFSEKGAKKGGVLTRIPRWNKKDV